MEEKEHQDLSTLKPFIACVGYPRTGTYAMSQALNILGFGPCWHGMDVMNPSFDNTKRNEFNEFWIEAFDLKQNRNLGYLIDWSKIFDKNNYQSCGDFPPNYFFVELYDFYAKQRDRGCKVILTIRDRDSWHKSVKYSIYPHATSIFPKIMPYFSNDVYKQMCAWMPWPQQMGGKKMWNGFINDEKNVKDIFEKRNEFVQRIIPKKDLLIYDITKASINGWKPLCEFLNVPIPVDDNGNLIAFPFKNDQKSFDEQENEWKQHETKKGVIKAFVVAIGVVGIVGVSVGLWKKYERNVL